MAINTSLWPAGELLKSLSQKRKRAKGVTFVMSTEPNTSPHLLKAATSGFWKDRAAVAEVVRGEVGSRACGWFLSFHGRKLKASLFMGHIYWSCQAMLAHKQKWLVKFLTSMLNLWHFSLLSLMSWIVSTLMVSERRKGRFCFSYADVVTTMTLRKIKLPCFWREKACMTSATSSWLPHTLILGDCLYSWFPLFACWWMIKDIKILHVS